MGTLIQVKQGLFSKLPTLASGEFGWCTDTKQLFIGSGTQNYEVIATEAGGNLNMNDFNITDMADPVDDQDAVTVNFLEDTDIDGGTF